MMKRFTIWTDETRWKKSAVETGLVYGIYDNIINNKTFIHEKEFGVITSYNRAEEISEILNERELLNSKTEIK